MIIATLLLVIIDIIKYFSSGHDGNRTCYVKLLFTFNKLDYYEKICQNLLLGEKFYIVSRLSWSHKDGFKENFKKPPKENL